MNKLWYVCSYNIINHNKNELIKIKHMNESESIMFSEWSSRILNSNKLQGRQTYSMVLVARIEINYGEATFTLLKFIELYILTAEHSTIGI